MGKVGSKLNIFRNFNIESRAHKVISKDKPIAAPRYKVDEIQYQRILKENPNIVEETSKKNPLLDQNLKNVFVVSHDINVKQPENPSKPLPVERKPSEYLEFGIIEPKNVPEGKIILRNLLKFLTEHQSDPKNYTSKKISDEFKIPVPTIENILKYYKVFEVYVPLNRKTRARFAGPSRENEKTTVKPRKLLDQKKINRDT